MTANRFLPSRYDEFVSHLTLGIEPIDALRRSRVTTAIDVAFDEPNPDSLHRLQRHPSLVYVLLYEKRVKAPFRLRFQDSARCFVPRRISYDVAPPPANDLSTAVRIGRPQLFPGAGYPVNGSATGIRGRVVWRTPAPNSRDLPVPWVRVEATVKGTSVGWAHGDDRGEFLLLLPPAATRETPELDESMEVAGTVTVFAPSSPPPVPPPPRMHAPPPDPLEHLAVEHVAFGHDDVQTNELPWAANKQVARNLSFRLGRLLSLSDPFVFHP